MDFKLRSSSKYLFFFFFMIFFIGCCKSNAQSTQNAINPSEEDSHQHSGCWNHAWTLHENNQILSVMDPKLVEFDENEALRVVGVALLCTQASPKMRPSMSRVVAMLAGDIEVSSVTSKPGYLTDWDFKDTIGTFMIADTLTSFAASTHNIKNSISKNDNSIGRTNALSN
ncbi:putative LRR receptor-like serine/threonine-protein kinase [Corchorus capsularis]|uniref:Putative LRR receptor-like serine/threonine-protein kinase n=1 Tax=Corchorus capsularis TaxID=210143 RepID=A0A1R3GGC4_COCAP|nr:putative LRR receptor-like serine/threonine-protein kinase [Corchorus capsularis]